ncbi:MAG: tetratricopeptide repeat protein [Nitrospinota bacterium]
MNNKVVLFSKKILLSALSMIAVSLLLSSCTAIPLLGQSKTVEEIEEVDMMGALMVEIKQLQARQEETSAKVKELEEMLNSMDPNFQEMMRELNERLEYLESKLSVARMDLDDTIKEINRLKLKQGLKKIEESSTHSSAYPTPRETMIPKKREVQKGYARALHLFNDKKYKYSMELLQSLSIKDSPEDLRDNIIFWIGYCYYELKKYNEAIVEFYRVIEEYPHANKVIDAREKIGFSYYMMGENKMALKIFKELLNDNPPPDIQTRIEKKIKEIEAAIPAGQPLGVAPTKSNRPNLS